MTQKKEKRQKAKVYIWPKLTDEDRNTIEDQCVDCGYTNKKHVKVGRVKCWEVS